VVHPLRMYSAARGELAVIIMSLKWTAGWRKQRYHWSPRIHSLEEPYFTLLRKLDLCQRTEMKATNRSRSTV
jgi:hypothetical protein